MSFRHPHSKKWMGWSSVHRTKWNYRSGQQNRRQCEQLQGRRPCGSWLLCRFVSNLLILSRNEEQYCEEGMIGTYNATGRWTKNPRWLLISHRCDQNYVLRIPDNLDLDKASIITLDPQLLTHANLQPTKRSRLGGWLPSSDTWLHRSSSTGAQVTVFSSTLPNVRCKN